MVTRSNFSNTSSSWNNDNGSGGCTWEITFPLAARDAPELGVDGAALDGTGAAGNLVQKQLAQAPEVQRVSTSAGSEIFGGFTLGFNGEMTERLQHNATAEEVRITAYIVGAPRNSKHISTAEILSPLS